MHEAYQRAQKIKLAIFDVDGVMTDGTLFIGDDGQEYKGFNSLDGHGLKMLKSSGVELAIITGRSSRVVDHRAANLGIVHVHQGAHDKLDAFRKLLEILPVDPSAIAYMGDDVIDLPVMRRCGLALTVPHAPALVKENAHHVTHLGAGRGAVREICELIMQAQGTFESEIARYLA
ncbi:MAG: HAD-IIIA family hydrolase [Sulfuricellaceae bacterium]|nr:HAD-IIIA family hydrolase [Sulfuricellaceae bacterium]